MFPSISVFSFFVLLPFSQPHLLVVLPALIILHLLLPAEIDPMPLISSWKVSVKDPSQFYCFDEGWRSEKMPGHHQNQALPSVVFTTESHFQLLSFHTQPQSTTLSKHTSPTDVSEHTQAKGHALMKLFWHEISRQDLSLCWAVTVETAVGVWMGWHENKTAQSHSRCFSSSWGRKKPNHVRCRGSDGHRNTTTLSPVGPIPLLPNCEVSTRSCSHCCYFAAVQIDYTAIVNRRQLEVETRA